MSEYCESLSAALQDPAPKLSLWPEVMAGVEFLLLHAAPVYYGIGVPRGSAGVVLVPGFLSTDFFLTEMYAWLRRLGYQSYYSGVGVNADCPNLLMTQRLEQTIQRAVEETGGKVHLIGHSLGGIISRAVAATHPDQIASVITLGSPLRGTAMHPRIFELVDVIRRQIHRVHQENVRPGCYTEGCTCSFTDSLRRGIPPHIPETAIYTRGDGVVDWRYCVTGNPANDFEVSGTHTGLPFNPASYQIIAQRLSDSAWRA